jgi:predicted lysophospholipase L1 biosynthesis ABC-type transport system permease subunit
MSTSKYIARLIGPLFLVMGLGMMAEPDTVRALSAEFLSNLSLIYLAGMLALVAGLAIVNAHNRWVADWPVIITILGWLSIIGGVIRLLFPAQVQRLGVGLISNPHGVIVGGIIVLVLGAILSWVAYEDLWQQEPEPQAAAKPARARAPRKTAAASKAAARARKTTKRAARARKTAKGPARKRR